MAEIINATQLIGQALEEVMAEVAEQGTWRDQHNAQWLLRKLEACVAANDDLKGLRGTILAGDLRWHLYGRWERPKSRFRKWLDSIRSMEPI